MLFNALHVKLLNVCLSGIGFYTALGLAKRRARVIIACRNIEKGQEAQLAIIKLSGNQNVILKELDLSSLQSVRQFASIILKEEKRLDILINNAGISLGEGLCLLLRNTFNT